MALDIRPSTSVERKLLAIETLVNSTDKISKVSENSVLSAFAGGISKVAGKAEKDIQLAVGSLFVDNGYDQQLDQAALNFGVAPRFQTLGSSTYVRLIAAPGTQYLATTHFPQANNGLVFELEEDVAIGALGFQYAKVRSQETGVKTNIDPISISRITPAPSGHIAILNEFGASGGRDVENDEQFRARIKDSNNILSRQTISAIEQVFIAINPKVLGVRRFGRESTGKLVLGIATQNGVNLTEGELTSLLEGSKGFVAITDIAPYGTSFIGIKLINIEAQPIDVEFRIDLTGDVDEFRKNVQIAFSKYIDFRYFNPYKDKVEWDNLLEIVKSTRGAKYVPDQYFSPRIDVPIATDRVPRFRGFKMLDLNGNLISNIQGTLSPNFYPNTQDRSFQETVLKIS